MANPTTNYGWPMPTTTDLVTDLPADFAAFGQPVDTTLKALNPETTLGDIAYRSSTSNTNTRLGIGSAGQVLTVAAGVPSWSTPAASGSMTLLSTTTLSGSSTSITSIDQTYTDLIIRIYDPYVATSGGIQLTLNSDSTAAAYETAQFQGEGGSVFTGAFNTTIFYPYTSNLATSSAKYFFDIKIPEYTNTTIHKVIEMFAVTNVASLGSQVTAGAWKNTSAISSVQIKTTTTWSAGTVKIYGVK